MRKTTKKGSVKTDEQKEMQEVTPSTRESQGQENFETKASKSDHKRTQRSRVFAIDSKHLGDSPMTATAHKYRGDRD
jgi:hypothetical protein